MGVKTEGEVEGLHESARTVRVREKRGGGSQREDRGEVDGNIDLLRVPCPRLHPAHPPQAPSPSRGSARISAPCVPSRALATHLSRAVPYARSTPRVIRPPDALCSMIDMRRARMLPLTGIFSAARRVIPTTSQDSRRSIRWSAL